MIGRACYHVHSNELYVAISRSPKAVEYVQLGATLFKSRRARQCGVSENPPPSIPASQRHFLLCVLRAEVYIGLVVFDCMHGLVCGPGIA
jgi:hypothetical protein